MSTQIRPDQIDSLGEDHRNVTVVWATAATVDVDFDILQVGKYNLTAGNLTIDITASGANGLDTGSEAVSTWYAVYVIYNPTTDTIAGLLSADTAKPSTSNAPTLPSGYTVWRHVGWVRNNGSGDFTLYCCVFDGFCDRGDPSADDYSDGGTTLTANKAWHTLDISALVPPGIKAVFFRIWLKDDSVNNYFRIRKYGNSNTVNVIIVKAQVADVSIYNTGEIATDSSRVIEYYFNSACDNYGLTVLGWRF